jgi:hypothetical protein
MGTGGFDKAFKEGMFCLRVEDGRWFIKDY